MQQVVAQTTHKTAGKRWSDTTRIIYMDLAGHESSKITMDIYAKVKYNRPEQLAGVLEDAFASWD